MPELFKKFVELVLECGPAKVVPQKTRFAIQARMRFAALMPRKKSLRGHLVLARHSDSRCFIKVDTYSSKNHVHVFSIKSFDQFDDEFVQYIRDAYSVGKQEHLK